MDRSDSKVHRTLLLPWLMLVADRLTPLQGLLEKHARLKGLYPSPQERDGLRASHDYWINREAGERR